MLWPAGVFSAPNRPNAPGRLKILLERAERNRIQQPKDKKKFFTHHAQEYECLSKREDVKQYEFGGKASIPMTRSSGFVVAVVAVTTSNLNDQQSNDAVVLLVEIDIELVPLLIDLQ